MSFPVVHPDRPVGTKRFCTNTRSRPHRSRFQACESAPHCRWSGPDRHSCHLCSWHTPRENSGVPACHSRFSHCNVALPCPWSATASAFCAVEWLLSPVLSGEAVGDLGPAGYSGPWAQGQPVNVDIQHGVFKQKHTHTRLTHGSADKNLGPEADRNLTVFPLRARVQYSPLRYCSDFIKCSRLEE